MRALRAGVSRASCCRRGEASCCRRASPPSAALLLEEEGEEGVEVPVRAFAGRCGGTAKRALAAPPRASGGRQSVEVPDLSSHNVEVPLSASCADTVTLEPCQPPLSVSIRPLNFNHFTHHAIQTHPRNARIHTHTPTTCRETPTLSFTVFYLFL
jgi:hypothetical protein